MKAVASNFSTKKVSALTFTLLLLSFIFVSRFVHDIVLVPVAFFALMSGAVSVSKSGLKLALGIIVICAVQAFLLAGQVEAPFQIFHLAYVLLIALGLEDSGFNGDCLASFCRLASCWNLLWLLLGIATPLSSISFWAGDGISRFQSTMPEPSFVGLFSAFSFYVLLRAGSRTLAYLNLVPLLASFSFSGAIALVVLGGLQFRTFRKDVLAGVAVCGALLLCFYVVAPDLFLSLVVDRVVNSVGGGSDESFILRFVAPVDLVNYTLTRQDIRAFAGLGVGNVEHYIGVEQAALPNHWRADGMRSTNPDSVLGFVVAAFGAVGVIGLIAGISWILSLRTRRPEYTTAKVFIALLAVFSGLFVSVNFWAWIFLLRQEQRTREDSSTGSAPSLSS